MWQIQPIPVLWLQSLPARVLHVLSIKAQRLGESQRMFHAAGSAHNMERPENRLTKCYSFMAPPIQKGITYKKKWTVKYQNIPSIASLWRSAYSRTPGSFPLTGMRKRRINPKNYSSHLLQDIRKFPWTSPLLNHTRSRRKDILTLSEI